jgi:hypothetical protein
VGLADFKRDGTRAPRLPQGHSASSLHTGNITLMWYMQNLFRVSNSQHIVAGSFTDPPLSAPVSHWHDVRWKSFQTLALPNDIYIIMARSKITAVAAVVIEVWHKRKGGLKNCRLRQGRFVWPSGVPRIFFEGWSTNSLRTDSKENGNLGVVAP